MNMKIMIGFVQVKDTQRKLGMRIFQESEILNIDTEKKIHDK